MNLELSTPSLGITGVAHSLILLSSDNRVFQLPLSGSRCPSAPWSEFIIELSTPSLGITAVRSVWDQIEYLSLSTPSLGITGRDERDRHHDRSGGHLSTPSLGIT